MRMPKWLSLHAWRFLTLTYTLLVVRGSMAGLVGPRLLIRGLGKSLYT